MERHVETTALGEGQLKGFKEGRRATRSNQWQQGGGWLMGEHASSSEALVKVRNDEAGLGSCHVFVNFLDKT